MVVATKRCFAVESLIRPFLCAIYSNESGRNMLYALYKFTFLRTTHTPFIRGVKSQNVAINVCSEMIKSHEMNTTGNDNMDASVSSFKHHQFGSIKAN